MEKLFFLLTIFTLIGYGQAASNHSFNVLDYGAVGDGHTSDSEAFCGAFTDACDSPASEVTVYVPKGRKYLLQPIQFFGKHCKPSTINFMIYGELIAPSDPKEWGECDGEKCGAWIEFNSMTGFNLRGHGTINGQGQNWWDPACNSQNTTCGKKPIGMVISDSKDVKVTDLNFKDSPQMHIVIEDCQNVKIARININSPFNIPHTNGIHIERCSNVEISRNYIGTGDDCVSIGNGTSHVGMYSVICGPGHGFSFGQDMQEFKIEGVHVKDVTFEGTENAIKIRTPQGGKGYARNMRFENIWPFNVNHPIIIDQYKCDHDHCRNQASAVEVSNITYENIVGTTGKGIAVKIACSKSHPCKNITMSDIKLEPPKEEGNYMLFKNTLSSCDNVVGFSSKNVFPLVPCLH